MRTGQERRLTRSFLLTWPVAALGPMLSGRRREAPPVGETAHPSGKTPHPDAVPERRAPARRPEREPQASTPRARQGGAAAGQRPD